MQAVILHEVKAPDVNKDGYYDIASLDQHDVLNLVKAEIDEAWYWYMDAPYEGIGVILLRKGDSYDLHDLDHDSCYSPMDSLYFKPHTLNALEASCSGDYLKECKPLFDAARS